MRYKREKNYHPYMCDLNIAKSYYTTIKMNYAVYIIGISIQTFSLLTIVRCQCPEYFRYFRNETTGEIMGIVEISKPPQNVPLHLYVILSVATVLPTKYVGRIELAKSKEESIQAILQGLPVYYRIYFPVRNPIPVVVRIVLNDIPFCIGPPAMGVIVTSIKMEHTLWYPGYIPLTKQLLDFLKNYTDSSIIPSSFFNPPEIPTSTEPNKLISENSCGTVNNQSLITNGDTTSPIIWPWLAAIYFIKNNLEFQCTGNLISKQHVVTVAHCLIDDDKNVPINMLLISLGRFNLFDWNESGSLNVNVAGYKFHPDYQNTGTYDSDLVIIKLVKPIEFTSRIRPICLWMDNVELEHIVGKSGYVVGWGNDGKRISPEPRISKVPIVSQEDCLRSNVAFIDITSNRTFCAGRRDGSGPCSGHSGSGLIMFHKFNNRYHLRGIFALSIMDVRTRSCDLEQFVVYIDIAKYLAWLRHEINFF